LLKTANTHIVKYCQVQFGFKLPVPSESIAHPAEKFSSKKSGFKLCVNNANHIKKFTDYVET